MVGSRPPGGEHLFQPSATRIHLRLAETRTFGNGVVLLRYQRPDAQGGEMRNAQAPLITTSNGFTISDL
jgi:hypothetical protein